MPTSDLDLPLLPSAEQIRRREFATIRRGYDPDQVRDYLGSVAAQIQTLEKDLKEARLQAESLSAHTSSAPMPVAPESDPYDRISKRFAGLIASADREASRIVDEAKTDADRIRVDAQASAESVKQEGTEALGSAREEADRLLGGLSERRALLVSQLQTMQSRLLGVAKDLETVIEAPPSDGEDATTSAEASSEQAETQAPTNAETEADELLDPRYEDLWIAAEDMEEVSMDIPDLASIELDFDQEDPDPTD
jgi:DivIVA domain-containing protein